MSNGLLNWLFAPSRAAPSLSKIGDWAMLHPRHGEVRRISGLPGYRMWDSACEWWEICTNDHKRIGIVCPEWEARRNSPEYAGIYEMLERRWRG